MKYDSERIRAGVASTSSLAAFEADVINSDTASNMSRHAYCSNIQRGAASVKGHAKVLGMIRPKMWLTLTTATNSMERQGT